MTPYRYRYYVLPTIRIYLIGAVRISATGNYHPETDRAYLFVFNFQLPKNEGHASSHTVVGVCKAGSSNTCKNLNITNFYKISAMRTFLHKYAFTYTILSLFSHYP
jgi:hypothetical protein